MFTLLVRVHVKLLYMTCAVHFTAQYKGKEFTERITLRLSLHDCAIHSSRGYIHKQTGGRKELAQSGTIHTGLKSQNHKGVELGIHSLH